MRRPQQAIRTSAFISATSMNSAVLALLSLKSLMIPSERAFDAFVLAITLGAVACLTLFTRRQGQAQLALELYLLALGGALAFFSWTEQYLGEMTLTLSLSW